jgi:hypothetical protein
LELPASRNMRPTAPAPLVKLKVIATVAVFSYRKPTALARCRSLRFNGSVGLGESTYVAVKVWPLTSMYVGVDREYVLKPLAVTDWILLLVPRSRSKMVACKAGTTTATPAAFSMVNARSTLVPGAK